MNGVRLPLALSLAGHAVLLAALVLLVVAPPPRPAAPTLRGIELILTPPQPKPPPAHPKPSVVQPPRPAPPPKPKPIVHPARVPVPTVAKPPPPRPRHERVIRRIERPPPHRVQRRHFVRPEVRREPIRPRFLRPEAPPPPYRPRYVPPPPPEPEIPRYTPPPRPPAAAATISPGYRERLIGWIEAHRYYPEAARDAGEEGEVLLRFRVDRSGRVLDVAVARSSGYPDLDQAALAMMRGATLPPFPPSMPQESIAVAVPIRFSLR